MKLSKNIGKGKVKLSLEQQSFIFGSLADLISIGFSVKQSLNFIETMSHKNTNTIQNIKTNLQKGYALPDAMHYFLTDTIYQQLKIADEHGDIVIGMREISKYIKLRIKQQRKLKEVAFYPVFLFIILFVIIMTIKTLILPQTNELAGTTSTSQNSLFLIIFLTGIVFIVGICIHNFKKKSSLEKIEYLTKIPYLGNVFSNYYEYYLASNLALMLKNGLDFRQIINVFLQFNRQSFLHEIGIDLKKGLSNGYDIAKIFRNYHFVSNEMIIFLVNGSTESELAKNLAALSDFSFKNMVSFSGKLIRMVQPVSFAIIGLTILFSYLQMLLPMYNSMKGIY